ncbi:xanthine/uracil permease [Streptomyces sp. V1I1]|nr:xanthine/uracil permease [Streptomyces sp. V1I1]
MLFATVTMVGINTLRRVDLSNGHDLTIASVSLGVGLLPEVTTFGGAAVPQDDFDVAEHRKRLPQD